MGMEVYKMKVLVREERCKECGICVEACPKKAISFKDEISLTGYRPVVINDDLCTGCGICYTMCPDWVFEILGDRRK
jgi:2-oxoglutarate ferredoxin oxidoreductase subunit delta